MNHADAIRMQLKACSYRAKKAREKRGEVAIYTAFCVCVWRLAFGVCDLYTKGVL
jgi:hypothetical protein